MAWRTAGSWWWMPPPISRFRGKATACGCIPPRATCMSTGETTRRNSCSNTERQWPLRAVSARPAGSTLLNGCGRRGRDLRGRGLSRGWTWAGGCAFTVRVAARLIQVMNDERDAAGGGILGGGWGAPAAGGLSPDLSHLLGAQSGLLHHTPRRVCAIGRELPVAVIRARGERLGVGVSLDGDRKST